jgi:hypothetical protein
MTYRKFRRPQHTDASTPMPVEGQGILPQADASGQRDL